MTIIATTPALGSRSCRCRKGFTVLELVTMIALLGILIGVLANLFGGDVSASNYAKLESDVAGLNHMIALYVSDGGSLAGITSPQAILDKMKRYRPQQEWQPHVGVVSGKLLDVRLQARLTSQPDSYGTPRAIWDRTKQRFELTTAGGTAVSAFYLDNTLTAADYGTETRTQSLVTYNATNNGWVWNTPGTSTAPNYLNPTPESLSSSSPGFNPMEAAPASTTPPSGSGAGSGGGSGGGGGAPPAQPTLALLPPPTLTPSGGTFSFSSFPNSVAIISNAIAGAANLMYSVNGGPWQTYTTPIPLNPAMVIQAQNVSIQPAAFTSSIVVSQTYYRLTSGFTGSDVASWGNATGGTNLVTNIQNTTTTSTINSGNTKLDLGNGQYLDSKAQNSLSFTPSAFTSITPNTWFNFGAMQISSGTTFYNSAATGATLAVNLNLSQPAINYTAYINMGIISTPGTVGTQATAETVQLLNPTTDFTVTIDGVQYRMQLQWVSLDPSASVVQGNNLLIFQGANAAVELQARFTSNY